MLIDESKRHEEFLSVLDSEEIVEAVSVPSLEGAVGREVHGAEVFAEEE